MVCGRTLGRWSKQRIPEWEILKKPQQLGKAKEYEFRMSSKQSGTLRPRCWLPETCAMPGFLPWPLIFWLLPPPSTPLLLTPRVPLQQQMWLLEQRGRCLGNSGTQHWERESPLPCSPGPVGNPQGQAQSHQRPAGDGCLSLYRTLAQKPQTVFENSDPGFQTRVFTSFFFLSCLK